MQLNNIRITSSESYDVYVPKGNPAKLNSTFLCVRRPNKYERNRKNL